jgi:flagellar protein FlaG
MSVLVLGTMGGWDEAVAGLGAPKTRTIAVSSERSVQAAAMAAQEKARDRATAQRAAMNQEAIAARVRAAAAQIEAFLRSSGRELSFRVDAATDRVVVSVIEPATGEVIRQIPGDDALTLARSLRARRSVAGALVDIVT